MAVTHELPRLRVRCSKPEAHQNVVEPALELCEQVFAGDALLPHGFLEIRPELVFEHAVDALDLLLLTQLESISDDLRFTIPAVLARREVSLFDCARRLEATLTLQKQLQAFSAT